METNEARIKLAEWMGWWVKAEVNWISPEGVNYSDPPDPFTDANDCEALIRALNEAGWFFQRQDESGRGDDLIRPVRTVVRLYRHRPYKSVKWRGDDYKEGVCELALKVLEASTGDTHES